MGESRSHSCCFILGGDILLSCGALNSWACRLHLSLLLDLKTLINSFNLPCKFLLTANSVFPGLEMATHSSILAWKLPRTNWHHKNTKAPKVYEQIYAKKIYNLEKRDYSFLKKKILRYNLLKLNQEEKKYEDTNSVLYSRSVMSNSLWPHGLQHARPPWETNYPYWNWICNLETLHKQKSRTRCLHRRILLNTWWRVNTHMGLTYTPYWI